MKLGLDFEGLSLPEQVFLVCMDDETGRPETGFYNYGIKGAVLLELLRANRIRVEDDLVEIADPTPVGDDLADVGLARIFVHPTRRSLSYWVHHLFRESSTPTELAAAKLIRKGILEVQEDRFLWLFPRPVFPAADQEPEDRVRNAVRQTILEHRPLSTPVAALVAILQGAGALGLILSEEEQDAHEERIGQIVESAAHTEMVRDAIRRAIADDSSAAAAASASAAASA